MTRTSTLLALSLLVASVGCRDRAAAPPSTVTPTGTAAPPVTDAAPAVDAAIDAAIVDATVVDAGIDAPPAPALAIVDAPIAWPPKRDALMLAYRRAHSDPAATDTRITPRMIVLHYTAGGSAAGTRRYFDNLTMESGRAALRAGGEVNVSAHFLVDRDGTIYRLMPEDRMARHAIGVNHISIGVENVGDEDRWPLTDAQVAANAALIRDLRTRWPIELVVGHHEVRGLEGTPWFVELDPKYRNRKGDPGPRFMAKVRAAIADLNLPGPPPPSATRRRP